MQQLGEIEQVIADTWRGRFLFWRCSIYLALAMPARGFFDAFIWRRMTGYYDKADGACFFL